jgi:hypothetical protein
VKAAINMNVYGDTCPVCCGDLDNRSDPATRASECLFCGCKALASRQSSSLGPAVMRAPFSAPTAANAAVVQASSGGDIRMASGPEARRPGAPIEGLG